MADKTQPKKPEKKAKKAKPLQVKTPDNGAPKWMRVGIFSAAGLALGVAWPTLAGVRIGPQVPGAKDSKVKPDTATVHAQTVSAEHVHVDEIRPRVDMIFLIATAAASDDAIALPNGRVQPDFVRVGRPLRKQVAERERPKNHFHQV